MAAGSKRDADGTPIGSERGLTVAELEVLLTGGSGLAGSALRRLAPPGWRIWAPRRAELDITDPAAMEASLGAAPWDLVINAAAYTAVDLAERKEAEASRVNATGAGALAIAAAALGIPIIHLSTDYVFDGAKTGPYLESDPVGPLSVYGASKAAGEQAVRDAGGRHVILRTAWLLSRDGPNFAATMLRLAVEGRPLRVVDDQYGCPTSADDLAQAIVVIANRLARDAEAPTGTYHFVNSGVTTWHGLAQAIFEQSAPSLDAAPELQAISTTDYGAAAPRPANAELSTAKLEADFGISPRPWREAVRDVVTDLLEDPTFTAPR